MITLWYDEKPPSINRLYFERNGQKILTPEGRIWKNKFKESRGGLTPAQLMQVVIDPQGDHIIYMWVYCEMGEVYNLGHSSMGGTDRRTKHRHKKWDEDGPVKVIQDAAAELLGFDDRTFITCVANKRIALPGKRTGVLVLIDTLDLTNDPFELDPAIAAIIPDK